LFAAAVPVDVVVAPPLPPLAPVDAAAPNVSLVLAEQPARLVQSPRLQTHLAPTPMPATVSTL